MSCQTCGRRCRRAECDPCARNRIAAKAANEAQWYRDTGHCGGCGQPGVFCLCTESRPCGCNALHEMGSGLAGDALDQFAVTDVDDNQGELFDA